jgi:Tfp pilus assembly protein PilN
MRNIDINILPQEFRAKPLVDGKTFALIVLVVLLGFGCFYFVQAKMSAQDEIANLETSVATMNQQATALSTNQEAQGLITSINQLKTSKQDHTSFVASKVLWGDAIEKIYKLVPRGVSISTITQKGNSLEIKGTAPDYTDVADFGRALNNDAKFNLVGLPAFNASGFTLNVSVAAGGGQ